MGDSPITATRGNDGGIPHPTESLPGPTGESNRLILSPRAPLLCLGPGPAQAEAQAAAVGALGGSAILEPALAAETLATRAGISGAIFWGDEPTARAHAHALSQRNGPILPLITEMPDLGHVMLERAICIDTTASGGNAQLLAQVSAQG